MRKETIITLNDNGTDKKFKIRQFSARQQQSFIMRLAFCLCESEGAKVNLSGVTIEDFATQASIYEVGEYILEQIKAKGFSIFSGLNEEKINILLDELIGCCRLMIDKFESEIDDENVESFKTLTQLQFEAFKFNFFPKGLPTEENSQSQQSVVIGRQKQ